MSATNAVQQLNRELANKLIEEAKQNTSAFAGRFVGIANGKVVVVTDDLDELVRRLDEAEPDSTRTFWVEIGRDYSKVIEIWEMT